MSTTGGPGEPGEAGRVGAGGAGGRGGAGGVPGGTGGPGGVGGTGGPGGKADDYARGRRRFRLLVMASLVLSSFSVFLGAVLFVRVQDAVDQSNAERAANVLRNCQDINERHDNTLRALDSVLAPQRKGASPEQLRELERGRASTVLIINALTPKRDCVALAARQVDQ